MTALESYVQTFAVWRSATVPETSYYDQIKALLDDAGAAIRPAIKAIVHLKDSGAGIPDLGLYADHQPTDQKPAHGVVEAKPISSDLLTTANSPQVARYAQHYGQVLVTNYYQFILVTRGDDGGIVLEERYDLALTNPKRDILSGGKSAVVLREPLGFDHGRTLLTHRWGAPWRVQFVDKGRNTARPGRNKPTF